MIAARLLQRIETHWEDIASSVITTRDQHPGMPHYRNLPDVEIRERMRDLVSNLTLWLTTPDHASLGLHFEELGSQRHSQAVPLHEVIQKLIIIKSAIRTYVSEQNYSLTPVQIYDELELLRSMAGYFDFVTYNVALGYDKAHTAAVRRHNLSALAKASGLAA